MGANEPQTLTANVFEILLSLADGEMHGYALMQDVEARTQGRVRLLPGTMYRAFHRLIESGLIVETEGRRVAELDDSRRRYYRLTERGRRVLEAEAERLAAAVETARAKRVIPGAGEA